jgi:uncharacterized protein YoxC
MENIIPWQAILTSPNSAWAVVFIILLIYVMQQNGKREERLTGIIENTLKEMTSTLLTLNSKVCSIEESIEKIEGEKK